MHYLFVFWCKIRINFTRPKKTQYIKFLLLKITWLKIMFKDVMLPLKMNISCSNIRKYLKGKHILLIPFNAGGILDRADSYVFTGALAYSFVKTFLPLYGV